MRYLVFILLTPLLWDCGTYLEESLKGVRDEKRDCFEKLPDEFAANILTTYEDNRAARDVAIAEEQTRLGVVPLLPTEVIAESQDLTGYIKPEMDPYPESIVAVGEPDDIRTNGYEVNHGKMGMTRVYETAEGSGQYFIVDAIRGDGVGGFDKPVIAETMDYALLQGTSETQYSYHSWHVSPANHLVRAYQSPEDTVVDEVRVCGCGARQEVKKSGAGRSSGVSNDASYMPPTYNIGIFLLPGSEVPTIGAESEFQAVYGRNIHKKIFVPSEGKTCEDYRAVC